MSKMDALRAMREARYAETTARATSPKPTAKKAAAKPTATKPTATKPSTTMPDIVESAEPALCGHRNMSGRTCTREHGHAAKSHRYS